MTMAAAANVQHGNVNIVKQRERIRLFESYENNRYDGDKISS